MNAVFCDKRDCLFCDVDGTCNCVMHDGIHYCKSESIDTKNDAADVLRDENAKLRELVRDYHTFLALAELAQPIGSVIAAHGYPTLSVKALDKRYRELEIEVEE